MQRKALKQLNKVTQWTNEKVFNGEKTALSPEMAAMERDVDPKRLAIERLHGTTMPFYKQLTKVKPTGDPYPPSGTSKDKVLHTEALGLVMTDVGNEVRGTWGEGLTKYGRARARLAATQEEFTERIGETYIAGMENAMGAVNDYKVFRKKLDSRRLALDAAISKAQNSKKDTRMLEMEADIAQDRFDEIQEECQSRMVVIEQQEESQWMELTEFMEAELEYFTRCKEIMEELRNSWPTSGVAPAPVRARAKSNASARSTGRNKSYGRSSAMPSDEEEEEAPNRSRSHSNASTAKGEKRRSMLPSFGSFGKKSGLTNLSEGLGRSSKRKSLGRDRDRDRDMDTGRSRGRDRYEDDPESRQALHSDEEYYDGPISPTYSEPSRTRSRLSISTSGVSLGGGEVRESSIGGAVPPPFRRTRTAPLRPEGHWVKALYDFTGSASDELRFSAGDIIEVRDQPSEDWWLGEVNGHHGLFPSSYCEEYVPVSTSKPLAPPSSRPTPARSNSSLGRSSGASAARTLPPPAPVGVPASPMDLLIPDPDTSDSEAAAPSPRGYGGFSAAEKYASQSSGSSSLKPQKLAPPAPPAPPLLSRSSTKRAPPPPPPASRRSHSASNILSSTSSVSVAPAPAFNRRLVDSPEPEGSPFAGSEDDEALDEIYGGSRRNHVDLGADTETDEHSIDDEIYGGAGTRDRSTTITNGHSNGTKASTAMDDLSSLDSTLSLDQGTSSVSTRPAATAGSGTGVGVGGLSNGLGAMHLSRGTGGEGEIHGPCPSCGCEDFTQNVFKTKGVCSTCFHPH